MKSTSLHGPLDFHLIQFSRYLRQEGLNSGILESLDTLKAMAEIGLPSELYVKFVTRSIFCSSKEDLDRFEYLFDNFWKGDSRRFRSRMEVSSRFRKKVQPTSIIWMGNHKNSGSEPAKESRETSGANAQERLCKTDFSKLTEVEGEALEELAQKLWQEMNRRLSRRFRESQKQGSINIRRTIRKNISAGGDLWDLAFKKRKTRKPRLVVLLDVSGSMDKYSFYLLRFIYAIQKNFKQVESFLFSTRLHYISDILRRKQFPKSLEDLTVRAEGWSSGTTMGSCFQEFNREYSKKVLSRQSMVLILSDGLDTGETAALKHELALISKRAKKIIWLNPLKGMKDYEPLAKGMRSALPLIDVFSTAHNLESLLELEKHLQNVQ